MQEERIGELQTFNASQGIAKERDLKLMLWHSDAMRQTRAGDLIGIDPQKLTMNDRKFNQVRGLSIVISAQQELISTFRAQIKHRALQKWRKIPNPKEGEKIPFEKHENDYKKIMYVSANLNACRMDILEADKTKKLDDDFILEKEDHEGKKIFELTSNFYEMLKELENTFEEIHLILLKNKCISAGMEEDDELTYKEKEKEAVRRVVEA